MTWAIYITTLCLSDLICRVGMVISTYLTGLMKD